MGHFYFHVQDGNELVRDEEGVDLPDAEAARRQALLSACELLAEAIKHGKDRVPDAFVIADEAGRAIEILPVAVVLPKPFRV